MAKFKVGDKVRRIVRPNLDLEGRTLEVGSVHTIAGVGCPAGWGGTPGLLFEGFSGPSDPDFFELVEEASEPAPVQHVSSRSNDPSTSKGAGKVKRVSLRSEIGLTVATDNYGRLGWTGKELADFTDRPLNSVTPRLAELRREGKIKDSGHRRDKQIVWVLA